MASDFEQDVLEDASGISRAHSNWSVLAESIRELSEAGLPLPLTLRTSAAIAKGSRERTALNHMADRLDAGVSLPEAVRDSGLPGVGTIAAALEAGHRTGDLYSVLQPVVYVESIRRSLIKRLRLSLLYPYVVVGVGAVLASTVVVVCKRMFDSYAAQMGYDPTTSMPVVSAVLIAVPIVFLIVGTIEVLRTLRSGRLPFSWCPTVGRADVQLQYYALISHLSILVDRNVPLPEAFEIAGSVAGGQTSAQANEMANSIRSGLSLEKLFTHFRDAPRVVRTLLGSLCCSQESVSGDVGLSRRLHEAQEMLASSIEAQIGRFDRTRLLVVVGILAIGVMGYALMLFWPLAHAFSQSSLDPALLG